MSRPPTVLDIDLRKWVTDASCGGRTDLPWLSPEKITPKLADQMGEICRTCPVLKRCASEALKPGEAGAFKYGGYYAGVIVPGDGSSNRDTRSSARRRLKSAMIF